MGPVRAENHTFNSYYFFALDTFYECKWLTEEGRGG